MPHDTLLGILDITLYISEVSALSALFLCLSSPLRHHHSTRKSLSLSISSLRTTHQLSLLLLLLLPASTTPAVYLIIISIYR